nr:ATP-binding cassette domain-containing protein [Nocardioides sp. TF02-7]
MGSDLVIETTGLRKEFRSRRGGLRVAVQGLDLAVPAGGVHGFLGPNGSGKTTTIRMLLGLARPTAGTMRLFGRPVPAQLPHVIGRVGAVVESPKFSPTSAVAATSSSSPAPSAPRPGASTTRSRRCASPAGTRTATGPTRSA